MVTALFQTNSCQLAQYVPC